jgi:hypothetical protein
MEADDANYIFMYDMDGTVIYDMKTNVSKVGFPLDMSLSDDGTKLVTSYLSFTTGSLIDHISFYNFSEVGQNEINKLVGGWPLDEGIIAPRVEFINDDTVCIYKDNGFTLCSMKEIPRVIKNVDLEGEINSILSNNKYIGFVLQNSGDNSKHLMIFDLKGNKVMDKPLDFDYKAICFSNNEIIMYNEKTCLILNQDGNIKLNYIFDSEINALYQSTKQDQYYYVNDNKMYIIQLEE